MYFRYMQLIDYLPIILSTVLQFARKYTFISDIGIGVLLKFQQKQKVKNNFNIAKLSIH